MSGNGPRRRPWWLYMPLGLGFLAALAGAGLLLAGLLAFGLLSYAYGRMGITVGWMAVILAAALLGSLVNIPVARLRGKIRQITAPVTVFGVTYRVPLVVERGRTTIAVDAGGAIVRIAVASYLICHDHLTVGALLATMIVTSAVFAVAPGSRRRDRHPGPVPTSGCGADRDLAATPWPPWPMWPGLSAPWWAPGVLNLPRARSLEAPMVSIGGAGTFDGVFLAGLAAVLLASL